MINETYEFLAKGGIIMIPIILCSIAAVTLFIERLYALRNKHTLPEGISQKIQKALQDKNFDDALKICQENPSAIAQIATQAIELRDSSRESMQEAMQDEAKRQVAKLERTIPAIGAIAAISPLLGLLGTVTGMIQVFGRVAQEFDRGMQANPGLLANGIWEALITTAAGLSVAIPTFLLHHFLTTKVDKIILRLEEEATLILNTITPPP